MEEGENEWIVAQAYWMADVIRRAYATGGRLEGVCAGRIEPRAAALVVDAFLKSGLRVCITYKPRSWEWTTVGPPAHPPLPATPPHETRIMELVARWVIKSLLPPPAS